MSSEFSLVVQLAPCRANSPFVVRIATHRANSSLVVRIAPRRPNSPFVIPSEVEESLTILPVPRDYNFWVYIVTNIHDSVLYTGMTNDLARRVSEHRSGEFVGFTSAYRCRKLLYFEHYGHVDDAIARETQLKKWSRSKKVALIATMNPRWEDLAPEILGEDQEMSRLRST